VKGSSPRSLSQGRHGKHHDLMSDIAAQIVGLSDGEAMKIPLEDVDVSLPNLRSAVSRAMQARASGPARFLTAKLSLSGRKQSAQLAMKGSLGANERLNLPELVKGTPVPIGRGKGNAKACGLSAGV